MEAVIAGVEPIWHIGTIGFSYPEWSRTLYAGASRDRLEHYSRRFNAVEINTTFYATPAPSTLARWRDVTPAHFRFALKAPRDITHGPTPPGALASPRGAPRGHFAAAETRAHTLRFLDSLESLGSKLGAVLFQFPRAFGADRLDELAGFLETLPQHAPKAVELRHPSWRTPEITNLLGTLRVTIAATDESPAAHAASPPGDEPGLVLPGGGFLYVRWLGKHGQFPDRTRERIDPSPRLDWWVGHVQQTVRAHPEAREVFGFFDNDFSGHAPVTARRLAERLGIAPAPPPPVAWSLFP